MPSFTTKPRAAIGHTAGTFNPLTGAVSTTNLTSVRFRVFTQGFASGTTVLPAVQFSDDGATWGSTQTFGYTALTVTADGWNYDQFVTWKVLFDVTGVKRYARFGVTVTATGGTAEGEVTLVMETQPVVSGAVRGGPATLNSVGSTSTDNYQALTEWLPIADFADADGVVWARFTFELLATSNQVQIAPAMQTADVPTIDSDDNWETITGPTARTAVGTTYPGTFAALWSAATAQSKRRWARFGFNTKNFEFATIEAVSARIEVDLRNQEK